MDDLFSQNCEQEPPVQFENQNDKFIDDAEEKFESALKSELPNSDIKNFEHNNNNQSENMGSSGNLIYEEDLRNSICSNNLLPNSFMVPKLPHWHYENTEEDPLRNQLFSNLPSLYPLNSSDSTKNFYLSSILEKLNRISNPIEPIKEPNNQQYKVHWSHHGSRLMEHIAHLYGDKDTSDVVLVSNGKSFYAHKLILASASLFFKRILENLISAESPTIIIQDASPDCLETILKYCYTGFVYVSDEKISKIKQLGEELMITGFNYKNFNENIKYNEGNGSPRTEDLVDEYEFSLINEQPNMSSNFSKGLKRMKYMNADENRKMKKFKEDMTNSYEGGNESQNCFQDLLMREYSNTGENAPNMAPGHNTSYNPPPRQGVNIGGSRILLWRFLLDLLHDSRYSPMFIRWIDRSTGTFRIMESDIVAKLWGTVRKNSKMNYEKMSRGMRTYYKKGILYHIDGTKLIYKFNIEDNDIQHRLQYLETMQNSSQIMSKIPSLSTVLSNN